ncbi:MULTISPECIES: hypothetical protein [Geobacillus]|uniref:Uncharacterized protein n=1 Tax=Geobacillus thermoleovorans TaxID=33941 RepID=A0A2Z3N7V8_GEOTH|nr:MULTISPECIES: hypothetical protein [Geobacillus]AMQ22239.1 hypothetical protein A0V43_16880 [Geobacillus sp. JS12]AWO74958.1 hypothetical protein C1N76_10950 [Geobacillus thermoleovorans]MBW7642568.1 hypothetical protein [Geobacillus thermoleovorans]MED4333340.1 hypothetical protein [Geobacillus stearothermophilus]MED4995867.1 hypothetical protein [Geobacillus stearothermophilus]
MKKIIGILSQVNMSVLLIAFFFLLYDLTLLKLDVFGNRTVGVFYIRELVSLVSAILTVKSFFKIENRYKEKEE